MHFEPEDPRLIDFALGECAPEEAEAIEAALENDPEARRFVDEMRAVAAFSAEALGQEPGAALHSAQREAIVAHAETPRLAPSRAWGAFRPAYALAATFLCGAFLLVWASMQGPIAGDQTESTHAELIVGPDAARKIDEAIEARSMNADGGRMETASNAPVPLKPEEAALTDEVRAQLGALGYLGGDSHFQGGASQAGHEAMPEENGAEETKKLDGTEAIASETLDAERPGVHSHVPPLHPLNERGNEGIEEKVENPSEVELKLPTGPVSAPAEAIATLPEAKLGDRLESVTQRFAVSALEPDPEAKPVASAGGPAAEASSETDLYAIAPEVADELAPVVPSVVAGSFAEDAPSSLVDLQSQPLEEAIEPDGDGLGRSDLDKSASETGATTYNYFYSVPAATKPEVLVVSGEVLRQAPDGESVLPAQDAERGNEGERPPLAYVPSIQELRQAAGEPAPALGISSGDFYGGNTRVEPAGAPASPTSVPPQSGGGTGGGGFGGGGYGGAGAFGGGISGLNPTPSENSRDNLSVSFEYLNNMSEEELLEKAKNDPSGAKADTDGDGVLEDRPFYKKVEQASGPVALGTTFQKVPQQLMLDPVTGKSLTAGVSLDQAGQNAGGPQDMYVTGVVPDIDKDPWSATEPARSGGNQYGREWREHEERLRRMPHPMPVPMPVPPRWNWSRGGESYAPIHENDFERVSQTPLSTFSVDVDTASYANVRRLIEDGQRPDPNAVRIEELVNYFHYNYPAPKDGDPFSLNVEVGACPWEPSHALAKIGLQGMEVEREERGAANLVFLLDVSGSMRDANKLPLVKEAMLALLRELRGDDRVGIVTYASDAKTVLDSTPVAQQGKIRRAIEALEAGGSTHGSAGLHQAYALAQRYNDEYSINRVILATDGDFNVGVTERNALEELITRHARTKIFLTVLGFGTGNLKDDNLETLADKGNGNYAYIDSFTEARRVLSEQLSGTLVTIAKDVKVQVEFNPGQVSAYRLLGYENRALAARDFDDDTKDAGEIGAGHTVTALYEIVPAGQAIEPGVDALKYQPAPEPEPAVEYASELFTVKLRYKAPEADTSRRVDVPVEGPIRAADNCSKDFRFAAAVAAYGMELRCSKYKGRTAYPMILDLAESGKGKDAERQAFIDLAVATKILSGN